MSGEDLLNGAWRDLSPVTPNSPLRGIAVSVDSRGVRDQVHTAVHYVLERAEGEPVPALDLYKVMGHTDVLTLHGANLTDHQFKFTVPADSRKYGLHVHRHAVEPVGHVGRLKPLTLLYARDAIVGPPTHIWKIKASILSLLDLQRGWVDSSKDALSPPHATESVEQAIKVIESRLDEFLQMQDVKIEKLFQRTLKDLQLTPQDRDSHLNWLLTTLQSRVDMMAVQPVQGQLVLIANSTALHSRPEYRQLARPQGDLLADAA